MTINSKSVAVIGAGPSGLVCAKILLDDGFNVTLFDRKRELGGIWSVESAYVDLHSQQPGGTLEFSDLFDGEEFACWQHVQSYLQKYADQFHITERIRFQTEVISISKDDLKNHLLPWIVKTEKINGKQETNEFNFVIIATGLFSNPYMPIYRGQHKFSGPILDPLSIKSRQQFINKRVIVVGGGKSATDMAVLGGLYARSCHFVFRKAHWMIPQTIVKGLLPIRFLFTRAMTFPFTSIPNAPHSKLFCFLQEKFPKPFKALTNLIENDLISSCESDLFDEKIHLPRHSFQNIENISLIPKDFIRLKREGRIVGKLDTIDEIIDETTVRLSSGEELQADMIVSATGFTQRFPFFSEKHAQMMGFVNTDENVEFNLYRRVIPVGIPNIGFIGFATSVGHWVIAEAASHWISDYFLKQLKLPDSKEMCEEIETNKKFMKKMFARNDYDYRYYWLPPVEIYLNDMGVTLYRTSNWISEYFGVYRPQRLNGLHDERRVIAQTGQRPSHFYFSFQFHIFLTLFLIFFYYFFPK